MTTPGHQLLVVDDDADIRDTLMDYLASQDFGVVGAADALQAREAVRQYDIDLVLLDLNMPGEDGLSLCRDLRATTDCAIVMLTGADSPVDRIVGLEVGADDYITKPFELREVLARIRSVLRRSGTSKAVAPRAEAAPMVALGQPGGERLLLSILFTDIVGSTELATSLGDALWRKQLERHDGIVLREVERHGGLTVKSLGDGFLSAFDVPGRAVACARAINQALSEYGISIRAGIHTGECELRDGDVAGVTVHVAARIVGQANAGQILVSRTVTELMLGTDISFTELGHVSLKGLENSWHLYSVED